MGRLSPDYVVQDGVVPRGHLGKALAEIDRLGQEYGLDVANVFHAGDGNLHPLILYDGRQEGALEQAEKLAGEILNMCIELGGSITGEHGVGMEKRRSYARSCSARLTWIRCITSVFRLTPKRYRTGAKCSPAAKRLP